MRGEKPWFDLTKEFYRFYFVGRDQEGRYKASSYGESKFSLTRWNIISSIIWIIGGSEFQCKEQNPQYYHREGFDNKRIFSWDFVRKNEAYGYGWR